MEQAHPASLPSLIKGTISWMGWSASSSLELSASKIHQEQLLKVPSPISHLTICVRCEATTYCLVRAHLRCKHGVESFQGSIGRSKIISIQMTLNFSNEKLDISLLLSPQESSSRMWQNPILENWPCIHWQHYHQKHSCSCLLSSQNDPLPYSH